MIYLLTVHSRDSRVELEFSFTVKIQVEIKRTIPKGAAPLKDFKTKKIFVGGLPSALKEGIHVCIIGCIVAS